MPVRQHTVNRNITKDNSVLLVTWSGLLLTDFGSPVSEAAWSERTVQVIGTFGVGGSVTFQGSNNGVDWATLVNRSGGALTFTAPGMNRVQDYPIYVRPLVTAGDGTTNLTVLLACHRIDISEHG